MKTTLFSRLCPLWLLLLTQAMTVEAQQPGKFSFEIGAGFHAFYLPGIGAHWAGSQPVITLGAYRSLNASGSLQAGISLGYSRHKYQGDGLYAQAQFRYNPVIFKHFEPGIGLGVGYQAAFYPAKSLRWDSENWVAGKSWKGMLQTPLRLSLGYRTGAYTPFVAYQSNVLFGYSPDLSPMPVSMLLAGVKFSPLK